MALGLVLLQHRLHLRVERAVIQRQALGQVLMYRGLADAELFRGGADGRPVFYEVKGQLPGPLFQILSDRAPLLYTFAAGLCIWRARRVYAFGLLRGGLCPPQAPSVRRRRSVQNGVYCQTAHKAAHPERCAALCFI